MHQLYKKTQNNFVAVEKSEIINNNLMWKKDEHNTTIKKRDRQVILFLQNIQTHNHTMQGKAKTKRHHFFRFRKIKINRQTTLSPPQTKHTAQQPSHCLQSHIVQVRGEGVIAIQCADRRGQRAAGGGGGRNCCSCCSQSAHSYTHAHSNTTTTNAWHQHPSAPSTHRRQEGRRRRRGGG